MTDQKTPLKNKAKTELNILIDRCNCSEKGIIITPKEAKEMSKRFETKIKPKKSICHPQKCYPTLFSLINTNTEPLELEIQQFKKDCHDTYENFLKASSTCVELEKQIETAKQVLKNIIKYFPELIRYDNYDFQKLRDWHIKYIQPFQLPNKNELDETKVFGEKTET